MLACNRGAGQTDGGAARQDPEAAETLVAVDDLYRPYRPKRRTRATIAKEKGLEPLANTDAACSMTKKPLEEEATAYIDPEKEVKTVQDALPGARDILAETDFR